MTPRNVSVLLVTTIVFFYCQSLNTLSASSRGGDLQTQDFVRPN